ncbi:lytic murein transglycosylase [Rhodovulum sp. DZ06]|uniref:lytic murein transglycosylase n=1 Tax=Rhodovulum sp. DZ06 TaxID=3425126 RepID=UPI003D32CBFB
MTRRPFSALRPRRALAAAGLAALAAGCASAGAPENAAAPTPRPAAETPAPQAAKTAPRPEPRPMNPAEMERSFAAWRADFRARALAQGVSAALFDQAFANVRPNTRVMELDAFQPEFVRPIWAYLDSAVSDTRVTTGREKRAALAPLLAEIEDRHGVDREAVLAIWGVETNFGTIRGSINVFEALGTLAWHGRRKDFAEEQLLAAFRIVAAGEITPEAMVGSWAGAMGHTQFIPTSYLAYAADHDGDGRRNVWGEDPGDGLASTAAYLARFGWEQGAPWGAEVKLPAGFDLSLADQKIRRSPEAWSALGVTAADGGPVPAHGEASIILPAGASGPAFAVFNNFRVIKRYNNATSYAMAVGLLAQRIGGAPDPAYAWPRDQRRMSVEEMKEVQALLNGLGFNAGVPDGIIGPNTQGAIRAFQRSRGLPADGFVNAPLLDALRGAGG